MTASNYYTGVIEPETSVNINKDSDREIAEVYVKVGDEVTKGQKLFAYKTNDVSLQIEQAKIELADFDTQIADSQSQINALTDQKATAAPENQTDLDDQIKSLNTAIKQAALDKKMKQAEIDSLNQKVGNAIVTSSIDGVVKSINTGDDSSTYMTILSTGAYQVKGTVDELNLASLSVNQKVKIHSRADKTKTWDGTITKIDTDSSADSSNDSSNGGVAMSGNGDGTDTSSEKASKYNFYVSVSTTDDLLLGAHVYIEPVVTDSSAEDATSSSEVAK